MNAKTDQTVGNGVRFFLRHGKRCNVYFVLSTEIFQLIQHTDLDPAHSHTVQRRIDIEQSDDHKSKLFKLHVIGECLPEISGTDHDNIVLLVQS